MPSGPAAATLRKTLGNPRHGATLKPQVLVTMETEFYRLKRLPPYVFAEVNAMKARARAAGDDIIDLGMGNPDQPTPSHIVDKLVEAARNPRAHRYSMSRGIPGLRKALAGYYQRRFQVDLDPESECIVTLGSKEGLANLASAITSPGDILLVPNPSYPIHPYGFIIAGGSVRHIPVVPDHDLLTALERAVKHSVPKPVALVLNYPSNPTALIADLDFYGRSSSSAAITASISCPTWRMPRSILATIRHHPSCRSPVPRMSPSSSPRCRRPTTCPAGASVLPPATRR